MPLSAVEGQERAIEALRRALAGGRLHHAYLFAGPEGVGKGLAAQGLAEALLCTTPLPDGDACGECGACKRTQTRQHPDLHIIERREKSDGVLERQIRIDQVRALQRSLSFKSYEGARRVVLLFEPEKMNPATSNALLKTLEEPGPDTHFALVTAEAHRLLPTIISRCQRVRFRPLERAVVARRLAEIAEIEPDEADLLAGLAEGSVGKGVALQGSAVLERRREIIEGADEPDGARHVPRLLDFAENLARPDQKSSLPLVFHLLRTWYRDVLLVKEGMPVEALVHRDLIDRLRQRAGALDTDALLSRLTLINDTEYAIFERNSNTRLSLESLMLRLSGAAEGDR